MVKRYLTTILAAALAFSALAVVCSAQDSPEATAPPPDTTTVQAAGSTDNAGSQDALYEIQPEDVLQVDVWGEPTLQKLQFQVTPDGFINVAYIGNIKATGLTAQALADTIAQRLKDAEILVDPKVQVTIMSVHHLQVRVLGQVQRPGMIEIKDGDTVIEAIAQAGSYIPDQSDLEDATITHKDSKQAEPLNLKAIFHDGDLSQNLVLKKGDTIYIPEDTKNKFYVMGEVLRPGQYQLRDDTTILSGIMQANGPTDRGSMKSTVLVRNGQRVPVNMARLVSKGDITQNVPLQPGDVIYVPQSSKPDWGKISQVLSAITSLGFIRRYGLF